MPETASKRSIGITVLLSTAIAGLVLLSAGLVLTLSSVTAWQNTFELLHTQAELAMNSIEEEVRTHVNPAMEISRFIRAQVAAGEIHPDDSAELITAFRGALAAAPQIAGVVLWDKDANKLEISREADDTVAVTVDKEAPTPELLQMLADSRRSGRTVWGPPNEGDAERNYVYTLTPLNYQGTYWGVMATGVTISNLSSILKRIGEQHDMTAFILYGDEVLGHPAFDTLAPVIRDGLARLPTIAELGDPIVSRFYQTPAINRTDKDGVEIREIQNPEDGRDYVMLSRANNEFGEVPWQIGIYGPAETLDKQIDRLIGSAIAGLLVLALAILCALWIARKISRPIRALADSAEHIGRLELDGIGDIPHSRIRELDDQAGAFNQMVEGLRWFETYVPKRLVRQLIRGRGDAAIISREVELTVMFTDIIGFTALSETMSPGAVGDMLNAHFEIIARCIEAEGGTLDKYIGDSVMAFWGAPEDQPEHARRACRAALAIAAALAEADRASAHGPSTRIKIAIHSGPLLVGNIGASSRMNYTVIGDTVNTASRIESLCGKFDDGAPAIILVSSDTTRLAGGDSMFRFEEVGGYEVKGRSGEVHVSRLRPAQS